jgi:hypothetical protein
MSTTVTFDSVEIKNVAPLKPKRTPNSFEVKLEGQTDDYTDVTNITAKAGHATKSLLLSEKFMIQTTGTKGSLVISGFGGALDGTYTNCVIMGDIQVDEVEGTGGNYWRYSMTIAQETKT